LLGCVSGTGLIEILLYAMEKVDLFLEKFKDISPPDESVKKEAVSIIHDVTGIELDTKQITVSRNQLRLEISPTLKSRIYMNKESIIERLSNTLHEEKISDIQ
jgi:hypothetical protein